MWQVDWSRLRFRDITAADGYAVTRWRNTASARDAFFNTAVVTPDTHAEFVRTRRPHDLVWIVEEKATGDAVGMLSLTVDVAKRTAEYGRAFIDERCRGRRYGFEIEWLMLHFAFDVLQLDSLWLDIYADNVPMCALHRKMGWAEMAGPVGVRHDRPVLRMTYDRATWAERGEALRQQVTQPIISEAMG